MLDISIENFEKDVIEASMQQPVLLDFWADWCGPCKSLIPVLEKLEPEYADRLSMVKVNVDEQKQIASMFGVRSVPMVVLMIQGRPVDGFAGALPEAQVRAFLDKHIPSAEEVAALQEQVEAEDAWQHGDTDTALDKLRHAVDTDPENDDARFDLVKLLLQQGQYDDAQVAFAPVVAKAEHVRKLDSLSRWLQAVQHAAPDTAAADAAIAANKRDFDARFSRVQTLLVQQHWTDALDELLEILMRDKAWNDDLARKTYIAILDIMEPPQVSLPDGKIAPEDPTMATYRRRLSSVILS